MTGPDAASAGWATSSSESRGHVAGRGRSRIRVLSHTTREACEKALRSVRGTQADRDIVGSAGARRPGPSEMRAQRARLPGWRKTLASPDLRSTGVERLGSVLPLAMAVTSGIRSPRDCCADRFDSRRAVSVQVRQNSIHLLLPAGEVASSHGGDGSCTASGIRYLECGVRARRTGRSSALRSIAARAHCDLGRRPGGASWRASSRPI